MDFTGMMMERVELHRSLKDIPIPPKEVFIRDLVLKKKDLINRFIWCAYARLNKGPGFGETNAICTE